MFEGRMIESILVNSDYHIEIPAVIDLIESLGCVGMYPWDLVWRRRPRGLWAAGRLLPRRMWRISKCLTLVVCGHWPSCHRRRISREFFSNRRRALKSASMARWRAEARCQGPPESSGYAAAAFEGLQSGYRVIRGLTSGFFCGDRG